jgi:HSP20 family molecular chaperone IbpA
MSIDKFIEKILESMIIYFSLQSLLQEKEGKKLFDIIQEEDKIRIIMEIPAMFKVDTSDIKVSYVNGVLEITIKKKKHE